MGALTSMVLYLDLTIVFDCHAKNRATVQISRELEHFQDFISKGAVIKYVSLHVHTKKKTISASDAIHSWQIRLFLVYVDDKCKQAKEIYIYMRAIYKKII